MYPDSSPLVDPLPPLVSLARLKELLGVPPATVTFDAQITFAADVVSSLLRSYTGRILSRGSVLDVFLPSVRQHQENGRVQLSLIETPLVSVTSLKRNGVSVGVANLQMHKRMALVFPTGVAVCDKIEVEYVGGYDPIPADLLSVMLDLARRQLAAMGVDLSSVTAVPSGASIKAVSVGALKVEYAASVVGTEVANATLSPLSDLVLKQYSSTLDLYRHPRMLAATP